MSRLVKQNENGTLYSENGYQCLQKLGKLEDIEDELGCPLDVVFKLRTEESILVKGYGNEFKTWETDSFQLVWRKEPYILVFKNDGYVLREYKLKDYKKTWWLKEDLSE